QERDDERHGGSGNPPRAPARTLTGVHVTGRDHSSHDAFATASVSASLMAHR
ncbi:MAG: hypothetical protein RL413_9, partial [Actinomycetota bacterium]